MYLIMDQSNTNQLEISPKLTQSKCVYDYFVLCKMFKIVCERKHEHLTQKKYNQVNPH